MNRQIAVELGLKSEKQKSVERGPVTLMESSPIEVTHRSNNSNSSKEKIATIDKGN